MSELRKCIVNGNKGYFHCWEQFSTVVSASPMIGGAPAGEIKYTLAIVEYEDGTVHKHKPTEITFKEQP